MEGWLSILSSSLASVIIGGMIVGFYNLRIKRNEFINDYYKSIIKRRVEAYEQLERLIVALKSTVVGADKQPYHLLFAKDDNWESAHRLTFSVNSQALWLSDDAFERTRDLNYLFYGLTPTAGSAIEFGKTNYRKIAELREKLEQILAGDMLELHKVHKFLKRKKKMIRGFQPFSPPSTRIEKTE